MGRCASLLLGNMTCTVRLKEGRIVLGAHISEEHGDMFAMGNMWVTNDKEDTRHFSVIILKLYNFKINQD